jgi:hypothetical protein
MQNWFKGYGLKNIITTKISYLVGTPWCPSAHEIVMIMDNAHNIPFNNFIDVSLPLAHEFVALNDVVSGAMHGH